MKERKERNKIAIHAASNKLETWKAVAEFIQPRLTAGDRLIAPPNLADCFPDDQCDSYNDKFSGKYQWVILHKGLLREADARGLIAACLVLEPVFANGAYVVFATRGRLKPLPSGDVHYESFLEMLEAVSVCGGASRRSSMQPAADEEIRSVIHSMIRPIVSGKPNLDPLAMLLKEMSAMKLNIKNLGYDLALRMAPALNAVTPPAEPQRITLKSKAATSQDIESPWQAYWCKKLGIKPVYVRKVWELCYVAQAVWQSVNLEKSPCGIGFGCGEEPLPSLFASMGANITVTDLAPAEAAAKVWLKTGQHTRTIENAFKRHLVDEETFRKRVTLKFVDMNAIPEEMDGKFDFCWSMCALEHLGSIQHGLDFIENSLRVLKAGGVAVHTTEFNFTDEKEIIDSWGTVVYRRKHFEQLQQKLSARGYKVCPLDFDFGNSPIDRFIDLPPYLDNVRPVHLKLTVDGVPSTDFGLIIKAP